jgi:hypothetical protein
MAITNITGLESAETFLDLVIFSNDITRNIFVPIMILGISIILFMSMLKNGFSFERSGLTSSYIMFLLMLMFFWAGLVPFKYFIGSLVFMIGLTSLVAYFTFRSR